MATFRYRTHLLHYTVSGSGPPLVLIHGLSGSVRWWQRNLPVLEREFTVYAPDLVGFGASRGQRVLGIRDSAALLDAWMQAIDLGSPAVIGHSMGGHTALHLAAARPESISRLVLVAASALVSGRMLPHAVRLPLASFRGARAFLPTLAFDAARAGPINLYRAARDILRDDASGLLEQVGCPTLLVWGERDVLVPRELGVRLAESIPGSRFVEIRGAGHNVMFDRADDFNRAVLPFLRGEDEVEA